MSEKAKYVRFSDEDFDPMASDLIPVAEEVSRDIELGASPTAAIYEALRDERKRCAKFAKSFEGYRVSGAGSVYSQDAKDLAEATADWIYGEILRGHFQRGSTTLSRS